MHGVVSWSARQTDGGDGEQPPGSFFFFPPHTVVKQTTSAAPHLDSCYCRVCTKPMLEIFDVFFFFFLLTITVDLFPLLMLPSTEKSKYKHKLMFLLSKLIHLCYAILILQASISSRGPILCPYVPAVQQLCSSVVVGGCASALLK